MTDPHDAIAAHFRSFAAAAERGDVDAFKELCASDVPAETQLFLANSERVQEHGWTLKLRRIDQQGEVAEVTFEAVNGQGQHVDEGTVTFTEEHDGWKIRSL